MNIMEAIKSGRKFRRPKWLGWVGHEDVQDFIFSVEDLTATDYYLEEIAVPITTSQFTKAWQNAVKAAQFVREDWREFETYENLKKELGL